MMKNKIVFSRLPVLFMGLLMSIAISCGSKTGSFTDSRDGKVYETVTIGDQVWMAENLAYAPTSGNYWAFRDDTANVAIYGYLYDWHTAQDVCPPGWHLPDDDEWRELSDFLGENAGDKLKSTGTVQEGTGLWREPNSGATNQTGFSALPSGRRSSSGVFGLLGTHGRWWSASDRIDIYGRSFWVSNTSDRLHRDIHEKEIGFSVRCVMN